MVYPHQLHGSEKDGKPVAKIAAQGFKPSSQVKDWMLKIRLITLTTSLDCSFPYCKVGYSAQKGPTCRSRNQKCTGCRIHDRARPLSWRQHKLCFGIGMCYLVVARLPFP